MRALFNFSVIVFVFLVVGTASSHKREEIAGMSVVFGGDREPLLDNEVCFLGWRLTDVKTEEPVTNLQNVHIMIKFEGKEFGPFETRSARRDPGMYRTRHIFTKPGEGEATLTFKREGEEKEHSLTLTFRIDPREAIEIP